MMDLEHFDQVEGVTTITDRRRFIGRAGVLAALSATLPAAATAPAQAAEAVLADGDEIDVRELGAIGDGASHPLSQFYDTLEQARADFPHAASLDDEIDWAAIQGALDQSDVVRLPPGEYVLGASSITMDGEKYLLGAAMPAVVLLYNGTDAALVVNSGRQLTTARWTVSELTIDCQGQGQYGMRLGQSIVGPKSANVGTVQSLELRGATQAGLHLTGSQINTFIHVHCMQNLGDGCRVEQVSKSANVDTVFYGCTFRRNERRGLWADGGAVFTFHGCAFEENLAQGVLLRKQPGDITARNWVFERCLFECNNIDQQGAVGQFDIDSPTEGAAWAHVELRRCDFAETGDNRQNVLAGKCQLVIWYPVALHPAIGLDTGTSAAFVTIWADQGPEFLDGGWELGGPKSPIVFHRVNRNHREETYLNSGGNWQLAMRLTGNGITTAADVSVNRSDRGLVLTSPDGTLHRVTVDDAGVLHTSPASEAAVPRALRPLA